MTKNINLKRTLVKESIVSGLVFLGVIYALNLIAFKNEFIKPIKQEFEDFDIYDMVFSNKHKQQEQIDPENGNPISDTLNTKIVLVEAGKDREEYLNQLQVLHSLKPKVLGVDIVFHEGILKSKKDSIIDEKLKKFLNLTPNVISGYRIETIENSEPLMFNQPFVLKEGLKQNRIGYVNFTVSDNRNVIREFSPYYKSKSDAYYSFAVQIVKCYDSIKWGKMESSLNSSIH